MAPRLFLVAFVIVLAGLAPVAQSQTINFDAFLNGPNESPPNASPGTGVAHFEWNQAAHTFHIHVSFQGLTGTTTASHIHAPTLVALSGTASVATTTPTFAGFPLGVTSGVYDNTLDLTASGSYNPSFVAANGGTTAGAENALMTAILQNKSYLNIHSNTFTGGEIRGFLVPEPASLVLLGFGALFLRRRH